MQEKSVLKITGDHAFCGYVHIDGASSRAIAVSVNICTPEQQMDHFHMHVPSKAVSPINRHQNLRRHCVVAKLNG